MNSSPHGHNSTLQAQSGLGGVRSEMKLDWDPLCACNVGLYGYFSDCGNLCLSHVCIVTPACELFVELSFKNGWTLREV